MTVELIPAPTRYAAWVEAARRLSSSGEKRHLVLDIEKPWVITDQEKRAFRVLDAFYSQWRKKHPGKDVSSVKTVANTIFPNSIYDEGLEALDTVYPDEVYPIIKKNWGTYAYRMLRAEDANGNLIMVTKNARGEYAQAKTERQRAKAVPFNPLLRMIKKMKAAVDANRPGACYELNIHRPTPGDAGRPLGGPCLSHLSFKLIAREVHLTALYRHHDYTLKAPGNLLGLAQLQRCVAREAGARAGPLVVHSTLAYRGEGISRRSLRQILNQIEAANQSEAGPRAVQAGRQARLSP